MSFAVTIIPLHFFFSFDCFTFCMISSTTLGSDNVLVSPKLSSSPLKIFLKILRIIFPLLVFGRSSTTNTAFGAAKGPIDLRTCMTRSLRIWSVDSWPSFRETKALTAWPVSSSLMPTTAASDTESTVHDVRIQTSMGYQKYVRFSIKAASISAVERR